MTRERFRWIDSDHGQWICACGEEFTLFEWCYETCPNCGKRLKMYGDTVIEEST